MATLAEQIQGLADRLDVESEKDVPRPAVVARLEIRKAELELLQALSATPPVGAVALEFMKEKVANLQIKEERLAQELRIKEERLAQELRIKEERQILELKINEERQILERELTNELQQNSDKHSLVKARLEWRIAELKLKEERMAQELELKERRLVAELKLKEERNKISPVADTVTFYEKEIARVERAAGALDEDKGSFQLDNSCC